MTREFLLYTAAGAIRALAQDEDGGVSAVIRKVLAILGEEETEAPQAPKTPKVEGVGVGGGSLPQVDRDATRAAKALRDEVLSEIATLVKDWPEDKKTSLREAARKAGLDVDALEALRERARKMAEEQRRPKAARKPEKGGSDDIGIF